jgi:NAD(P)-dependent dehydrogenase (short-subunit alcohol dehydrogenase family)
MGGEGTRRQRGRVALVTGGAAGIGQAFCERLATDGAEIVIADIADASETLALVEAAGGAALVIRADASSADDVRNLAQETFERFGKVDVLVHNAGIYPFQDFLDLTFEDWRRVLSVNLDSMFHVCHEFLPGMVQRGWGRIVCMASTTFHAGLPGVTHYNASKGGLIGVVRSLAAEVGDAGVTVNALAPSLVRTKGTTDGPHEERGIFASVAQNQAIKRTELPGDLVGALSFLASDEASFITGQTLVVDGGFVRA